MRLLNRVSILRSVLALVLGAMLLAPLHAALAEDGNLVRLTFGSGWNAVPSVVAIERGLFAEQGLIVSGIPVSSAEAALKSVSVGTTDFAALPQRSLLLIAAAQLPVSVVSMNGWGTQLELVAAAEDIRSVEDLRGKTIAVGAASEAFPVLVRLLNAAGLPPSAVTIKRMDASGLLGALAEGEADAVFESRHFTGTILRTSQARRVLAHEDIVATLGQVSAQPLVVNRGVLEKHPDLVQRFVTAWVKALAYVQHDPEDSARLLQIFFHRQGTTVKTELARSWVELTRYDRAVWSKPDILDAEYNGWGLVEGGVLASAPKLEPYIDNRFAEKAVDTLDPFR